MKKNYIQKISFALVAILLLVNLFVVVAFANHEDSVKWWLTDDQLQITNETEGITYSYAFYGVSLRPASKIIYVYSQYLSYYESYVNINRNYPEVIWLNDDNGNAEIFVTETGYADIKSFVEGNIGSLRLEFGDRMAEDISRDMVAEWDEAIRSDSNTEVFDVRDIKPSGKKVQVYYISAVDVSKTLSYNYGAIYRLSDGEYWYVNYTDLPNNYFDADGNFSYRGGSVRMTRLSDTSDLEGIISNAKYIDNDYIYEWDSFEYEIDEKETDTWLTLFWAFYTVCVIIPPIPMILLGFILPFIKKLGKPKYWYSLLAFALLWLIFAIALAILLIIV